MGGPSIAALNSSASAPADYFTAILTSTGTECATQTISASGGETITQTRSSSGYCTKVADGAMVLKTTDQARISSAGVLIEGARTNYVLRSEELDHADWSGSATVVSNQAAPPWSASLLMDNVASVALSNRYQCPTAAATTSFSSSGYARTASGTQNVIITAYCVGTSWLTCRGYTSSTDYVGGSGGQQCTSAVALGTTAEKVTTAATCNGSETTTCIEVQGIATGSGNAHWSGIQLEAGAFSSSYIPTTGTSAARSADVLSFVPSVAISAEGCISGTVTFGAVVPANGRIIGTASGAGLYVLDADSLAASDGNSTTVADAAGALARSSVTFRMSWSGSATTLAIVDGDETTGGFDGDMDMGTVYLGSQAGSSNFLYGWVKNLKFGSSATGCM